VVRAGVASEAFLSAVEPEESKRKWDAEGRFLVSYVGTHGNAHDLWSILRAAEKISTINPDVLFFFAGQGAEATQLRDHASSLGLTNVKFLGGIDRREIPSLLNASDICLATLRDSPIFRTVVPTKLYEYMAAGRPIICNVPGEATEMLERAGTGVYVPAADPDALVGAIKMLIADPERRFAMGRAGREAVRKDASWESRADDYLEILKRIVDRNRG
jgi:glycosyltransferase involved in cell wall biosynthesis